MSAATLEVRDLVQHFPMREHGAVVHAVDGVTFDIAPGEVLGLVGVSGSGKSTVANCVLRMVEPTGGTILLKGEDITHLKRRAMRPLRADSRMVFQFACLAVNPPMSVGRI